MNEEEISEVLDVMYKAIIFGGVLSFVIVGWSWLQWLLKVKF